MPAWRYLENGGRHAELIWHRRAGKDEICLHRAAVAAFERPASYWHMLPEAAQARKAIWQAVNPRTGQRRIDDAFPHALRATTREQEMQIVFKNGSTWQVVGSDNYNSLVGASVAGVTMSEWALAKPAARAFIRPILLENNGWQLYISTPRGKNHAHATYSAAMGAMRAGKDVFAQLLTANDTGVMSAEVLAGERAAYQADFGVDQGDALFRQEYLCDFNAAILGAYFGREMSAAQLAGRITSVPYDPAIPVQTFWDLGYSDDTSIWFMQRVRSELHLIDHFAVSGADVAEIADAIHGKPYKYGDHWLPHDARAKTLASNGKSVIEQLNALKIRGRIVPSLSVQDGIQAARALLPFCWFDEEKCSGGIHSLQQYQREWDEERRVFKQTPLHNFASHDADAFRMMAVGLRDTSAPATKPKPRFLDEMTVDELWNRTRTNGRKRI
jgi:hypothetical protein